ncbi:MAG: tRNA (adenosine(37)-N6)-dimethylallyltransferase MiaA [Bacteroidota bacterium]
MNVFRGDIIVVLGPTASSKTAFAAKLAREMNGEVISADSRQVYRKMDIGTGKDYDDYVVDGVSVPYHLIDIYPPGYKYNVYEYQKDFLEAYEDIKSRKKMPVLCGGTGMYIEAVLKGYKLIHVPPDEELRTRLKSKTLEELKEILLSYTDQLHNTTDLTSKKRAIRAVEIAKYYADHPEQDLSYPTIRPLILGIKFDRPTQRKRITRRLESRLENGMIEEVENLMKSGLSKDDLMYYGLEYKYLALYLTGELTYNQMFEKLNTAIHQFAKRQITYFRRMQKNGLDIHWLDGHMSMEEKLRRTDEIISQWNSK